MRRSMHLLAVAIVVLTAPIVAQSKQAKSATPVKSDPLAGLDAYIEKVRTEWKIAGVAVGIVKDDSLIYAKGFGLKEIGKSDSVTPTTIFAIGSNTKSFTSALAAILVDDGKMAWNDKVTKWLPGFQLYDPYATRELTIRDVLSHRSGLGRRGDPLWYGTNFSRAEVLRRIRYLEPNAGFRTEMGYQNIMFLAGGEAEAAAGGASWDDLIKRRIFEPLGMRNSSTSPVGLPSQSDVSTPHSIDGAVTKPIPWRNLDNAAPAGSINSNIVEMGQYVRFQLGDGTYRGTRIVSAANLNVTKTPHVSTGGVGDTLTHFSGYGLGWVVQDYRGRRIAWHNGGIDGMLSEMWTIPEEKLGIIVLTNSSPHSAGPAIVWSIVDRFLVGAPTKDYLAEGLKQRAAGEAAQAAQEQKLVAARVPNAPPSLPLAGYAGTYSSRMYGDLTVAVEGAALVITWQNAKGSYEPWHYNTFRGDAGRGRGFVTFQLDRNGKATELDFGPMGTFTRPSGAAATP